MPLEIVLKQIIIVSSNIILILMLGFYFPLASPNRKVNRAFFMLCLAICSDMFLSLGLISSADPYFAAKWVNIFLLGKLILPVFLANFMACQFNEYPKNQKTTLILIAISCFGAYLSFILGIFKLNITNENGNFTLIFNNAEIAALSILYFISIFLLSYSFYDSMKMCLSKSKKIRITLLSIGSIAVLTLSWTQFYSMLTQTSICTYINLIFVASISSVMAYSQFRGNLPATNRFSNILSFIITFNIYLLSILLITNYVSAITKVQLLVLAVFSGFLFHPTMNFLKNIISSYFPDRATSNYTFIDSISKDLVKKLDIKDVVNLYLKIISNTLNTTNIHILLKDSNNSINQIQQNEYVIYSNKNSSLYHTEKFFLSGNIITWFLNNNRIFVRKYEERSFTAKGFETLFSSLIKLTSEICIPIIHDKKLLAVISVGRKRDHEEYSPKEIEYLQRVCQLFKTNLLSNYFFRLTAKDPLTDTFHYRFFQKKVIEEFEKARNLNYPLTVMVVNIDYMERLNKEYGRETGDIILKEIAELFKEIVHDKGIISRYSGSSFSILYPCREYTKDEGISLAENLRKFVQNMQFSPHKLKVTVSIGLSTFYPHKNSINPKTLVQIADDRAYKAVQLGRNKICCN